MISTWINDKISIVRKVHNSFTYGVLGVDIGLELIKMVKLNPEMDKVIDFFDVIPYPKFFPSSKLQERLACAGKLIANALNEYNVSKSILAISIPNSATIIKSFSVDARLTSSEIESRTWIEARRLFPDLISEINLDFFSTGPMLSDPSKQEIKLIVCRKVQMQPFQDMCKHYGLNLGIIDINGYAFERALRVLKAQYQDKKTVALLNIDIDFITLIIIHNNEVIHFIEESYNGENLKKYLNVDNLSNDVLKSRRQNYFELYEKNFSPYFIRLFKLTHLGSNQVEVDHIFVSGELSKLPFFIEFINQITKLSVELANPFKGYTCTDVTAKSKMNEHCSSAILSFGLALANLNSREF